MYEVIIIAYKLRTWWFLYQSWQTLTKIASWNWCNIEKNIIIASRSCARRGASFKEDEGTWKGNDDGKVVNNQPQRVMDDRNGIGPQSGYIAKITNDARETEMEDNMGQVNTMIGNLRNMAIDMGSELENQNRQIDRINRKVSGNAPSSPPVSMLHIAVAEQLGMAIKSTLVQLSSSLLSRKIKERNYEMFLRGNFNILDIFLRNSILTFSLCV